MPGLWRFHVGRYQSEDGSWDSNCGFSMPDSVDGHHHLTPPFSTSQSNPDGYYLSDAFKKSFTLEVLFKDWTTQVLSVSAAGRSRFPHSNQSFPQGEWTMVNDEGFNVDLADSDGKSQHSFFAFNKYMLNPSEEVDSDAYKENRKHSYCGQTLLGWYKHIDASTGMVKNGECFWGERVKSLHEVFNSGSPLLPSPVLPYPMQNAPSQKRSLRSDKSYQGSTSPSKSEDSASFQPATAPETSASTISPGSMMPKEVSSFIGRLDRRTLVMGLVIFLVVAAVARAIHSMIATQLDNKKARCSPSLSKQQAALAGIVIIVTLFSVAFALWMCGLLPTSAASSQAIPPASSQQASSPSIKHAAARMHAGLQKASASHKVYWQSNPEKLAEWVRERQTLHGIDIHEHSSVQKLLDAFSPPLAVGLTAFSTQQDLIVDPARATAIKEQEEIAQKLGKKPSDLSVADLHKHLNESITNRHKTREFVMNGQPLAEDGWEHLRDFDWRKVSTQMGGKNITNFVAAVPDQGPCGSCYAFAATSMFTGRLMLRFPELHSRFAAEGGGDRLSAQQQVYCNSYNQGCRGGYPYLIAKWSSETEMYTEKCVEQTVSDTKVCPTGFNAPACDYKFRVTDYRYVGGAFGRCGLHHLCEAAIREELYKGGPLTASMDVPPDMTMYKSGVFHSYPGFDDHSLEKEVHTWKDTESCKDTECFVWRKVGHSVNLVGWGEDTSKGLTCQARVYGKKDDKECEDLSTAETCGAHSACIWRGFPYWTVQNSWGKHFGENGFIRIGPRGQNPRWIESFAVAADMTYTHKSHMHNSKSARHSTIGLEAL